MKPQHLETREEGKEIKKKKREAWESIPRPQGGRLGEFFLKKSEAIGIRSHNLTATHPN